MKARKLVALLTSAMIGFQAIMPVPVAFASESEAVVSQEEAQDLSYITFTFNGEEQSISMNEETELRLLDWKDEAKDVVLAEYHVLLGEEATIIPVEFSVTEEVTSLDVESVGTVRFYVQEAEEFHFEEVQPSVTIETVQEIVVNDNGTSIEQAIVVDETGFILERKEDFQYVLIEEGVRSVISEEEYHALNEVVVEEPAEEAVEEVPEEDIQEEEQVEIIKEVVETEEVEEVEPEVVVEQQQPKAKQSMMAMSIAPQSIITPSISYSTHVQSYGWTNEEMNGGTSGTSGEAKRLEAIKIQTNMENLGVSYTTHVEKIGWMPEVSNNALSGTEGQAKRLEAIKIRLTGSEAQNYDIYYRVHAQTYGWLGWAKNGAPAGTEGLAKRLEAIEIMLVEKGGSAPGSTANSFVTDPKFGQAPSQTPTVSYSSYVEGKGWMPSVTNGGLSGTSGEAKRIEAIRVGIENVPGVNVRYSSHLQSYGWLDWSNGAGVNGLPGEGKRLEAIKLELAGKNAAQYDIYYRVHAQRFGWLGWAKNGEPAGTEGYGFRAESYEVKIVPKGTAFDRGGKAYLVQDNASVIYSSHIEKLGWLADSKNGQQSGTVDRALRMEALKVSIVNDQYSGGVQYRTHVQSHGWMNPVSNGAMSGTEGQAKRVEAVQINLTGEMAERYDIYYRVHSQSYGWLGWAKNGMSAGTEGLSKRVENIEIKLIEKGLQAPKVVEGEAFIKANPENKKPVVFLDIGHGGSDSGAYYYGTAEKDLNMQIGFKLEKHLKAAGFDVIMSRTSDVFIDHKTERSEMANASNADIFISLHNNAMPGNSYVNGIETFWYEYDSDYEPAINGDMHNDPTRLRESEKLAHSVHNTLISATGAYDRKVRRDTFAVLRETKIPAVLLEFGFMSNYSELTKLKSNSYQETLAKAVTSGVVSYFGK